MKKKVISFVGFLLLSLFVFCFTGCNNKPKQESKFTGFEQSMTNADSTEVEHLVNVFFKYAESGKYNDAVAMLYQLDENEEYTNPKLLGKKDASKVYNLLSSLPILSHQIDYIKFHSIYSNEVKCTAIIQPAHDNVPEIKTQFYFKPINDSGNWKLCLLNSYNGDSPVVDGAKKDSMEKEYAKELRDRVVNKHN